MSDRPTDPFRRGINWSAIGVWLSVAATLGCLLISFIVVREASAYASKGLADHEQRLRALEDDDRLGDAVTDLKLQISELKGEVRTLREVVSAFKVEAKRR